MKESPEIVEHIKELVVMGGHLNEVKCYDKVLPYGVDYNLCSDPEASFTVLTSAICKVTLVTADVTLQTWLTNSDLKNLEASKSSFLQLLCEDIKKWSEVQR
jgi:inosine-uridine nucleoside N-ribohydrolase